MEEEGGYQNQYNHELTSMSQAINRLQKIERYLYCSRDPHNEIYPDDPLLFVQFVSENHTDDVQPWISKLIEIFQRPDWPRYLTNESQMNPQFDHMIFDVFKQMPQTFEAVLVELVPFIVYIKLDFNVVLLNYIIFVNRVKAHENEIRLFNSSGRTIYYLKDYVKLCIEEKGFTFETRDDMEQQSGNLVVRIWQKIKVHEHDYLCIYREETRPSYDPMTFTV